MKFHYQCGKCKAPLSFGVFRISNKITCPNCKKEYMIYKNTKWQMVEMFFIITVLITMRDLFALWMPSLVVRIIILCIIGVIFNFVYDFILGLFLKEAYFSVEEKYVSKYDK